MAARAELNRRARAEPPGLATLEEDIRAGLGRVPPVVQPDAAVSLGELQVLRRLASSPRGLDEAEASRRLLVHGDNVLPPPPLARWWERPLSLLRDPYIVILCVLAIVSALTGGEPTAVVLACLVAIAGWIRLSGERHVHQGVAALRAAGASTARTQRRDGQPREVPVEEVVPGDIVRLSAGDLVPADLYLLRSQGLSLDQQVLTGESTAVAKGVQGVQPNEQDLALVDQPRLCLLGSRVAAGSGTAVVIATGGSTYVAGASHGYRYRHRPLSQTAFHRGGASVTGLLTRLMLAALVSAVVASALLGHGGWQVIAFSVAVAMSLTPEMLPVVVTVALARGAGLLRRQRVVVKRLPSVHDLGAIDVLCADKTGTLTSDRLTVELHVDAFDRPSRDVLAWAVTNSLICAELGDPPVLDSLDQALLDSGVAPMAGEGVAVVPFDPVRRMATAVIRQPGRFGTHTLVVKGAVEEVVARCGCSDAERSRLAGIADGYAGQGLRLLAVAVAERSVRTGRYSPADEYDLTLVGLVGFGDEPSPSAASSLASLREGGVAVKIVTGDHPGTAARACRDVGIEPGDVVTGAQLDALDDAALRELAESTVLFARATPAHKARVVQALRANDRTVGFLGDGLNDVPALEAADVGICPANATPAARESADVVLARAGVAALGGHVASARRSVANILTYLRVTLAANLGNVIAMITAGALLPFLPLLPSQILIQNLCFDSAQLALAYDRPGHRGHRAGRRARLSAGALWRFVLVFGLINAVADVLTFVLLGHLIPLSRGSELGAEVFRAGWFTENLVSQAITVHLLRAPARAYRGADRGSAAWPVRLANVALVCVGLLVPLSPLAPALGFQSPPVTYYAGLFVLMAGYAAALLAARRLWSRQEERG